MTTTKAQQRERQRVAAQRKQVKHGIGKRTPKDGISKQRKKMIAKKISIKRPSSK